MTARTQLKEYGGKEFRERKENQTEQVKEQKYERIMNRVYIQKNLDEVLQRRMHMTGKLRRPSNLYTLRSRKDIKTHRIINRLTSVDLSALVEIKKP